MREASTVNRDSSASVEFFSALEPRPSHAHAAPAKTANWRSTFNNPLLNVRETTGLNPIDEDLDDGRIGSIASTIEPEANRLTVIREGTQNFDGEVI